MRVPYDVLLGGKPVDIPIAVCIVSEKIRISIPSKYRVNLAVRVSDGNLANARCTSLIQETGARCS